ncbi:MAG: response regulator [Candidatus Methylomirabilales bacterium]
MGRKGKIKIVIADEQKIFRERLIALVNREEDLEVVGEAASRREILRVVEEAHPDVLLCDLSLMEVSGSEILPEIRERSPGTKVLILTTNFERQQVFHALRDGARGYLQKSVSDVKLLKAIRVVHAGEAWIERSVVGDLLDDLPRQENLVNKGGGSEGRLSKREGEVARFVAEGFSNKEVADRLSISEKTVKSHLASIFRKLELRDRLQLALYILQRKPSHDRSSPSSNRS